MAISGVSIMEPDSLSLLNWGANYRPMTLDRQGWRLLTNCFLHIGIFHLIMNMYALMYIGILLEPRLGKARFLAAYLLSGIVASVTSLWWHHLTISAGASGAIFGMYGVFLALLTTSIIDKSARKPLLVSIGIFVGFNLLYGLKGGIDNAAHLGGLVSGFIIGYCLIPGLKKPGERKLKYGTIGVLTFIIMMSSFLVYIKLPNDLGKYDERMKVFAEKETRALELYNFPENTPNEKLLYALKEKGIPLWIENIQLIDSLDVLDLPSEIRTRNRMLKEYCQLRIKSYEVHFKSISEETHRYSAEISRYDTLIQNKINELKQ